MSTKRKRKPTRRRKPSTSPKFAVGDRVRVKYGTADFDFPDIPLADLKCYCSEGVGLTLKLRHEGEQTKVVQARVKSRSSLFGFLSNDLCLSAPQSADERDSMLLSDLELTKNDANWQLFKDFSYWFWNH